MHHWPSVSLRGIHRCPRESPHKGPIMWKMYPRHHENKMTSHEGSLEVPRIMFSRVHISLWNLAGVSNTYCRDACKIWKQRFKLHMWNTTISALHISMIVMMTSSNVNIFRVTGPVRGIHWSPVNSPHKGQWRGAWMFYFTCAWTNIWVNNRVAGDLRRHWAHCDYIVMVKFTNICMSNQA